MPSHPTDTREHIAPLMATILHQDEPNHIKVDIVKEELTAGRYRINASHIATKLLECAPVLEETLAL